MRILVGAFLAILFLAASAQAGEERPSSIVGTVTHHGEGTKAEVTVHRLGGTEIQDQRFPELEEAIVRTVATDAAGHFDVADLESGFYTLVARKESALAGDAVVCLYAGARSEANIPLEPARTLSGVVTWTDGRPVEGIARFRMQMNTGRTSSHPYDPWWDAMPLSLPGPAFETTLVDGTFRIALPSRATSVTIDTPDGFRILGRGGWHPTEENPTVAWTVDVPETTVAGRVVDEAGTAVPGATVRATHYEQDRAPVQTVATSDPDGRFALRVVSMPADVWVTAARHVQRHDAAFEGGDQVLARHTSAVVEGRVMRSGEAVAGAVVHVVPTSRMAREWWADARHTRSDADGRYRIADVPAVPAAVFVRGGGFASVDLASLRARGLNPFGIDLAAGEVATRILEVEPALGLQGRVVDHEGRAVVGTTILALGVTDVRGQAGFQNRLAVRAHVGPFVATTDADGRFAYHDLVPGHLLAMRVDAPGMPQLRAVLRPGSDSALSELRFARPRYLTARLVDAKTGSAIPKAWVYLASFAESRRTDADGIARFGPLGDGVMRLQIRAEGFVPVTAMKVEGSADGPGPFDVTVPLERGLTITGLVLDEDGTTLGGAHVSALHRTDRRSGLHAHTTTDAHGKFTLQGLFAGTWDLRAEVIPNRRRNGLQAEAEAQAGATDVTLRFDKKPADSRVFTIRVTDPDGNPIPSARARLVGFRGSSPRGAVRDGEARLDAEAIDAQEFEEGHVYAYVSGAQTNNAGERPPYGVGIHGPLRLDEREITVALPPERTITGRVVDPEGEPVNGARVVVLHPLPGPTGGYEDDRWSGERTDDQGRFTVHYLGEGTHVLEVDAGPRFLYPRQEADAGARDVEIHLARAETARVVILDPAGTPVPGALLRLSESTQDRSARQKQDSRGARSRIRRALRRPDSYTAADDGSIVLEGLTPGKLHDIRVYGRQDDLQDLRLANWTPADGELRLERGVIVAGAVIDEDGQPVTDAVVALDGEGSWHGNRCREDGTFRYARLRPGTYRLLAGREGVRWEDPIVQTQTVEGGTEGIVVRLPTPFFEPAGDERQIPLESLLPATRESAERSLLLLYALSKIEALQTLNDALGRRPAPALRARGVWPRQSSDPWPVASLSDSDIKRFATLIPGTDTFGLLVTNTSLSHLPAAHLSEGDRALWNESVQRLGNYETLDALLEALAAFLGDTTAFAVGRRSDVFDARTNAGFYLEPDDDLHPGPALAIVAPLKPSTEPAEFEAWLSENRRLLSALTGAWRTPCFMIVDGHLVLANQETFLSAFLDTIADPAAHPPLAARATFAAVSAERMRGAHAYAFLDVAALRAVPSEAGEGRKGFLWDCRNRWVLQHRSPRDAAVARRSELLEEHVAKHGRTPSESEQAAIEEAVYSFWEAYKERYPEFEREYAELLQELRGHALSLAFHVSRCFVHGELVVYLDPPEASAEHED